MGSLTARLSIRSLRSRWGLVWQYLLTNYDFFVLQQLFRLPLHQLPAVGSHPLNTTPSSSILTTFLGLLRSQLHSLSIVMPRVWDSSKAAWLYPFKVRPILAACSSLFTTLRPSFPLTYFLTGYILLCVASLSLAFIQDPSHPHCPPFGLHLRHPLSVRISPAGRVSRHLPRRRRVGQWRLSGPGRGRRHCGCAVRGILCR